MVVSESGTANPELWH